MDWRKFYEGKSSYYLNKDKRVIDLDVHLAYIVEKIEALFGYLRKEFEGVISAENLGPKFGEYGSFLPVYRRSPPVFSHPRTPQNIQIHNPLSSIFDLESERTTEAAPEQKLVDKSINPTDKKTTEVRINVGGVRELAPSNVKIHHSLGLDDSPSSSLKHSSPESGELSSESHEVLNESLTRMLQDMTSFPVPGATSSLLSPLCHSLLHLMEKGKLPSESRCELASRHSSERSTTLVDQSRDVNGGKKDNEEMKKKPREENFVEANTGKPKDACEGSSLSRNKINAGKSLPSKSKASDITWKSNKYTATEEFLSDPANKEVPDSLLDPDMCISAKQNLKTDMADSNDSKTCSLKDVCPDPINNGRSKDDKSCDPSKYTLDGFEGRKNLNVELDDPREHPKTHEKFGVERLYEKEKSSSTSKEISKRSQEKDFPTEEFPKETARICSSPKKEKRKCTTNYRPNDELENKRLDKDEYPKTHEKFGVERLYEKEKSSSTSKEISKRSQEKDFPTEEFPKETARICSSPKKEKRKCTTNYRPNDELENKRLDKESGKAKVSSIGLLEKNKLAVKAIPRHKPTGSVVRVVKTDPASSNKGKERSSGRKVENRLKMDVYLESNPDVTPLKGNIPLSNAVPATETHVALDDWVCCDRCETWRLLPFGRKAENLPEHWKCSMLDWLPGMNRCSFSQEETEKAVRQLYQLPAPANQNDLNNLSHGAAPGVPSAPVQHLYPIHKGNELTKKVRSGEAVNGAIATYTEGRSNPKNEKLQTSLKRKNLHDANQIPLDSDVANRAGFWQSSDPNNSNLNSQRGKDQGEPRVLKKSKTASYTDKDQIHVHDRLTLEIGPDSMNGCTNNATEKDDHEYGDMKYGSNGRQSVTTKKKLKEKIQVSPKGVVKSDNVGTDAKKRKLKEWRESQTNPPKTLPSAGSCFKGSDFSVKGEMSDSENRKEKKAKVSKYGENFSSSKDSDKKCKGGRVTRVLTSNRNSVPHQMEKDDSGRAEKNQHIIGGYKSASGLSLGGVKIIKKDLGYMQPSVVAASSSSKVSRKSGFIMHEVKNPPVQSVSSSSWRISNPDKVIPARRKPLAEDHAINVRLPVMDGPRKCSGDAANSGNVPFETGRADRAFPQQSLVSSVLNHQDKEDPTSGDKSQTQTLPPSSCIDKSQTQTLPPLTSGRSNASNQNKPYLGGLLSGEHGRDERPKNNFSSNGCQQWKSGNGSSRSENKHMTSKSANDEGVMKVSGSFSEQKLCQKKNLSNQSKIGPQNHFRNEEPKGGRKSFIENNCSGKKDSVGVPSSEGKKQHGPKLGGRYNSDVKRSGTCSKDVALNKNPPQVCESVEPSNKCVLDITDHLKPPFEKRKSESLPYSGSKQEVSMKLDNQNGTQDSSSSDLVVGDLEARNLFRKESSRQAATSALKEAKDLKHAADRLKNNGLELDSAGLYFQAALKFLHGASILERCNNNEGAKESDTRFLIEMYSTTGILCEFVAREYEKLKEMGCAALAYKCMEVAYLKVVYIKSSTVSKDQNELQTSLQMLPPDESPTLSTSDVVLAKIANSPPITEDHVIAAQNHPNFVRLLDFVQDIDFAMEASKKSHNAYSALECAPNSNTYASVKSAIDFTFYNIEELLRLVRLALEVVIP